MRHRCTTRGTVSFTEAHRHRKFAYCYQNVYEQQTKGKDNKLRIESRLNKL